MLHRLLPQDIPTYWETIKEALFAAPPPLSNMDPEAANGVLEGLLGNAVQCWVSYKEQEEGVLIEGIILTTLVSDLYTGTRNLLLYCVRAHVKTEPRTWIEGLQALQKFGSSLECSNIVGYTNEGNFVKLAQRFGGEVAYAIRIPCNERKDNESEKQ